MQLRIKVFVLLAIVDTAIALIPNATISEPDNHLNGTRRKKDKRGKDRSTSSSSGEKSGSRTAEDDSLEMSDTESSSQASRETKPAPTNSGKGWRRWHRRCTPCPEDMTMKWIDQRIQWICAKYQRARRSFKSLCMMHYRNCQDGTMFVKIHDHRCQNATPWGQTHGHHFFYDYDVKQLDDSSKTVSSSVEDTSSSESHI